MKRLPCLLSLLLLFGATVAEAKNLDLSTVPERQSVELTIYNSEDLTLVRESRTLSFRQGNNPLQFSWSNTLIDPTSVVLKFDPGSGLQLRDTTFPHDKPQMLYWNVSAERDLVTPVEISYFTSGINWSAHYVAVTHPEGNVLDLDGFVRVENRSGEAYQEARVRLVVGKIHLVERVAELARLPVERLGELKGEALSELRYRVARKAMAPMAAPTMEADLGLAGSMPKEVAKEGLGEYFIYTIEGTETIPNGWGKRLRSFRAEGVPFKPIYRYRRAEYGDDLVRLLLLTNDRPSKLGETPIPAGEIRILQRDPQGGLAHLASQALPYVPIGDKIELNLGTDPEVIFELVKTRLTRDNIWLKMGDAKVYRRVGDGHLSVDHRARVAGWDLHEHYRQRIRNHTHRPIQLEVRRAFSGDVRFRSDLQARAHDYRTVEYTLAVPPGERRDAHYEVVTASGYNAKQNRVVVEPR